LPKGQPPSTNTRNAKGTSTPQRSAHPPLAHPHKHQPGKDQQDRRRNQGQARIQGIEVARDDRRDELPQRLHRLVDAQNFTLLLRTRLLANHTREVGGGHAIGNRNNGVDGIKQPGLLGNQQQHNAQGYSGNRKL